MRATTHRFDDALAAIDGCYGNGWTDGLPVVPPTEGRVQAMLDYVGLKHDDVIAELRHMGVIATAESVAANAVMAGCLPEYMPVVLAGVQAATADERKLEGATISLAGTLHVLVVNGPVIKEIGINSGHSLFGPGTRANAAIGHALRLFTRNVCKLDGSTLDRPPFSQPGRYGFCFGENEGASPWEPLHVQLGFPGSASTVTYFPSNAPFAVLDASSRTPEAFLEHAAFQFRVSGWTLFDAGLLPGVTAMLVLGPEHVRVISGAGWSKADVQQFLWPRLTAPAKGWEHPAKIGRPENIWVVVAGGEGLPQSWWFAPHTSLPVTKRVAERKAQGNG